MLTWAEVAAMLTRHLSRPLLMSHSVLMQIQNETLKLEIQRQNYTVTESKKSKSLRRVDV